MQSWFLLFMCIISVAAATLLFNPMGVNSIWLEKAVSDGDVKAVKLWLAMGGDINHRNRFGGNLINSALPKSRLAKHEERKKVIKILVDRGLSLLHRDRNGYAPIHYVTMRKYSGYPKFLASLGADLNQPTSRGLTPLMMAIRARDKTLLKVLLDGGALPGFQNQDGQTVLHYAVETNSHLLEFLLTKVTDLKKYDKNGYTPLALALVKGNESVYDTFEKAGFRLDGADEQGWTALHYACEGKENLATKVLERTKNPAAVTKMGLAPLHIAASMGHRHLCEKLLKHSVPLDPLDSKSRTPFYYALCGLHTEICRLLMEKGAKVDTVDEKGRTLLHLIAASGSDELVCFMATLLEKGLDIEKKDNDGRTPLHLAAGSPIDSGVKELIALGAIPDVKDNGGKTPTQLANNTTKRKLLAAASNTVCWRKTAKAQEIEHHLTGPPLYCAVRSGDDFLFARMLAKKGDVNEKNRIGRTALHYAAELGQAKILDLLLKASASRKLTDNDGKTASQLAKEKGHSALAAKLDVSLEKM